MPTAITAFADCATSCNRFNPNDLNRAEANQQKAMYHTDGPQSNNFSFVNAANRVQQPDPPSIEVHYPPVAGYVTSDRQLELICIVKDGARQHIQLFHNGRETGFRFRSANGRLTRTLRLSPGLNVIELYVVSRTGSDMQRWEVMYLPNELIAEDAREVLKEELVVEMAPGSSLKFDIVQTALEYQGKPYRMGGTTPRGFDCSGFVCYVMDKHQVSMERTAAEQARQGKRIPLNKVETGDLLFFSNRRRIDHVAIVVSHEPGMLMIVHSTSSRGIYFENYYNSDYWQSRFRFARRVIE